LPAVVSAGALLASGKRMKNPPRFLDESRGGLLESLVRG
jgi:hypothetical protein